MAVRADVPGESTHVCTLQHPGGLRHMYPYADISGQAALCYQGVSPARNVKGAMGTGKISWPQTIDSGASRSSSRRNVPVLLIDMDDSHPRQTATAAGRAQRD